MFIWGSLVMFIYLKNPKLWGFTSSKGIPTMASASQQKNARPNMLPKKTSEVNLPEFQHQFCFCITSMYTFNISIKNIPPLFLSKIERLVQNDISPTKTIFENSIHQPTSSPPTQNTLPLTWATKKKKGLYFPLKYCLYNGDPIMVYHNPHITG